MSYQIFSDGKLPTPDPDIIMAFPKAKTLQAWEEMDAQLQHEQKVDEVETASREATERLELLEQEAESVRITLKSLEEKKRSLQHNSKNKMDRNALLGTKLGYTGVVTSVLSGFICGLIMFSFCVAFASLIFNKGTEDYIALGVEIQCVSVMIGLFGKAFSRMPFSIFGPDIIPALFLAAASRNILDSLPANSDEFIPTLLVTIMLSSSILGIMCVVLFLFNGHRAVNYLPISVLRGFLACIGLEVMKAAWKTSAGHHYAQIFSWNTLKLELPAFPMGILMYFAKRYHIGNPVVTMASFLVGPIALFFLVMTSTGMTMEEARSHGWFYEPVDFILFDKQWTTLDGTKVNGMALGSAMLNVTVMVLVCSMDILLKLQSSKQHIKMEVDMDHELKVNAAMNILSFAFIGAPVYSQVKFNILSYGITHNKFDKLPGIIVGMFAGIIWFSGYPIVNYIPRFFLGGLLVYAGMSFVVDNIIESYWRLSKKEYFVVIAMVVIIAIFEQLVYAVLAGVVLAAVIFAVQYGRIQVVRSTFTGADYDSRIRRGYVETQLLQRLGKRLLVIRLQHFIFFGTANQILDIVRGALLATKLEPPVERFRYIIFDFGRVYNVDWTGVSSFIDMFQLLGEARVRIIVCGICDKVKEKFQREGVLENCVIKKDFDLAAEYVESCLLSRAMTLRMRWFDFESFQKLNHKATMRAENGRFEVLIGSLARHMVQSYVKSKTFSKGEVICAAGSPDNTLYFLFSGKASAYLPPRPGGLLDDRKNEGLMPSDYESVGSGSRVFTVRAGSFLNENALFSNDHAIYDIRADEPCSVHLLTREKLKRMKISNPTVTAELFREVLKQVATRSQQTEKQRYAVRNFDNFAHRTEVRDVDWRSKHEPGLKNVLQFMREANEPISRSGSQRGSFIGTSKYASRVDSKALYFRHYRKALRCGESGREISNSMEPSSIKPKLSRRLRKEAKACLEELKGRSLSQDLTLDSVNDSSLLVGEKQKQENTYSRFSTVAQCLLQRIKEISDRLGYCPSAKELTEIKKLFASGKVDKNPYPKPNYNSSMDPAAPSQSQVKTLGIGILEGGEERKPGCATNCEIMEDLMTWERMERVVEILVFAKLNREEELALKKLFNAHADKDGYLSKDGLKELLVAMGSKVEATELRNLASEWGSSSSKSVQSPSRSPGNSEDSDHVGEKKYYQPDPSIQSSQIMNFHQFLSMCAAIAKRDELIEQVERDFLVLARNSNCFNISKKSGEAKHMVSSAWDTKQEPIVTAQGIVRTFERMSKSVPRFLAEEMLYDADLQGKGYLTIDQFVAFISIVHKATPFEDLEPPARLQSKLNSMMREAKLPG